MPIYVYKCEKCEKEFELFKKFSQTDNPVNCDECGGACEKQVSSSTFRLIGKFS